MGKILAITWKELYTTFRDRNLILIMFLTPIILSTLMGLAFGGLGSGGGVASFQNIPIVVVNLDEGLNIGAQLAEEGQGEDLSLDDLTFEIGGETISLGEQLQRNPNLELTQGDLQADNAAFNFGETLASILLSQPVTLTQAVTNSEAVTGTAGLTGFDFGDLNCPLVEEGDGNGGGTGSSLSLSLDELLAGVAMSDPDAARAAVDRGEFVAAVIIPAAFSSQLIPSLTSLGGDGEIDPERAALLERGRVEVYANPGSPISSSIVRAVVEGVVNQLVRMSVALDSVVSVTRDQILLLFNLTTLDDLDLSWVDPALVTQALQGLDPSIAEPLACLFVPNVGNITLEQQPLTPVQSQSAFAFIMIILGSAQAIFFALFTGIFGMNSIYDEQRNWTLQRLIASPTPRYAILAGKFLGNLAVVALQLIILFASFTVITSLVEGELLFIWGESVPALLAVVLGISLFVSGLGVMMVGVAKSPEQVQFFGPMVAATLGALGGSFGFRLPQEIAGFSPIWWGAEALVRLSNGDLPGLITPLLVLYGSGVGAFLIGTILFRRRIGL